MTWINDLPDLIVDAVEADPAATRAFRLYGNQSITQVAEAASMEP